MPDFIYTSINLALKEWFNYIEQQTRNNESFKCCAKSNRLMSIPEFVSIDKYLKIIHMSNLTTNATNLNTNENASFKVSAK